MRGRQAQGLSSRTNQGLKSLSVFWLWLGHEALPFAKLEQEPGLGAGGRALFCCMIHPHSLLNPTQPQTPASPHGHRSQPIPPSSGEGPSQTCTHGIIETCGCTGSWTSLSHSLCSTTKEEGWDGRDLGNECSPRFRTKTMRGGPFQMQCLRAGLWSQAALSSNS